MKRDRRSLRSLRQRPLTYWDDVRTNNSTTFETRPGSAVYSVESNNETVRLVHLLSLLPYSETSSGTRRLIDSLGHGTASVILAIRDFNERRSAIVKPELSGILGDCNVYMTVDIVDTLLSPIVASRHALEYFLRPNDSLSMPYPVGVYGAIRSAVTEPLSILAGVYQTTVVNGQSTSSSLDNKDMFPTFTRALPTNRIDSKAVVAYFKSLGVEHFGILFIKDPYGNEYNRDLRNEAAAENMTVVSAPWDHGDEASIVGALEKLKSTQFRYFHAILAPSIDVHKLVIRKAVDVGMMGNPKHVWMFSEASNVLREDSFFNSALNSSLTSDREIASALNGAGLVVLEIPPNEAFDTALRNVGADKELFDYYVSRTDAPELFDTMEWRPVINFYQYSTYDAIMSLGIGLCSLQEEFPTGPDIVKAVKDTRFVGSSGPVSYDSFTGTRSADSVRAKVINFVVHTSEDTIEPDLRTSAHVNVSSQEVEVLSRFLYADGTLDPPLALPALTINYNLLSTGVRVFGWIISGLVIVIALIFGFKTWRYRNKNIIRVAQPVFLGLLCIGAALMASAIIPMSFQEPMSQRTLDAGCMAIPWLFVIGFATAFSALFCKLRRLNKVFRKSHGMQHVEVKAKDVIRPFVVLFVANFCILLAWTLVAPLRWSRVEVANYDQFGRSVESYGTCFASSDSGSSVQMSSRSAFLAALGIFNFAAVILANYQCYLSRHVPSDFNESYYITLSMLSILEGFLLGIPILFLTIGKPTAQYVVSCIIIVLLCMAILIPTIGSKLLTKKKHSRIRMSDWRRAWREYDGSSSRQTAQTAAESARGSSPRDFSARRSSLSSTPLQHQSSVAAIRARVAEQSSRDLNVAENQSSSPTRRPSVVGSSGSLSREFARRSSTSTLSSGEHLSSVAAIRARVAENAQQPSL